MFPFAELFNQNFSSWDKSIVTDSSFMFWSALSFNNDVSAMDYFECD